VQRAEQTATKMECKGKDQLDKLRYRSIDLLRRVANNDEIVKGTLSPMYPAHFAAARLGTNPCSFTALDI